jgi:hypothetical protein
MYYSTSFKKVKCNRFQIFLVYLHFAIFAGHVPMKPLLPELPRCARCVSFWSYRPSCYCSHFNCH